ncbi:DUF4325 domain-containing protein [Cytophagales bacterium LB-30]|uniref:DUF4325 domain-containing protein n=1 Tax=Shiella aurantiaca TaxID=3058365 RepID=A0ABT8F474_9BACT|nr:DUF4325 domain-containing protein [Shiella aurantiaca]MDN4165039.1 DUF4325 domain-containing protein [Shiella aurantiaca]
MKEIKLSQYGPIVSSKTVGDEIYTLINSSLKKEQSITINLENIKSMATFCAKQIFGKLYIEMGSQQFFDRITLKGADNDLKTIIQIGIQHALEERK